VPLRDTLLASARQGKSAMHWERCPKRSREGCWSEWGNGARQQEFPHSISVIAPIAARIPREHQRAQCRAKSRHARDGGCGHDNSRIGTARAQKVQRSAHQPDDRLIPHRREADEFFAAGCLAAGNGRTFRGQDHCDDRCHLDVVVTKCNRARKGRGRQVQGRPPEAVPRYSTRKKHSSDLHEGAHPRRLTSMPGDAC